MDKDRFEILKGNLENRIIDYESRINELNDTLELMEEINKEENQNGK